MCLAHRRTSQAARFFSRSFIPISRRARIARSIRAASLMHPHTTHEIDCHPCPEYSQFTSLRDNQAMLHMAPTLPKAIIGHAWAGLSRQCPECGKDFVSQFNRGRCPHCEHTFYAMDVHGPPPNVNLEQIAEESAIVSAETSDRILKLLTERADALPERPEQFDNPKLKTVLDHEREMWDWNDYLMKQAIANGGELWRWSTSSESWEAMMGACGLAVVKDGRITACSTTAMN